LFLKSLSGSFFFKGVWSYSYAVREKCEDGQYLETRTPIDRREYAVSNLKKLHKRLPIKNKFRTKKIDAC